MIITRGRSYPLVNSANDEPTGHVKGDTVRDCLKLRRTSCVEIDKFHFNDLTFSK